MDISVIVPTFNRKAIVVQTLQTLFAQDYPASRYEIIVVVDGSTDGTADAVRTLVSECELRIVEQENRGLAGARNTGFRVARSPLVLFLDDDMRCSPHLLSAHIHAHHTNAEIVGFGALFLSEDSRQSLASECFNSEIGAFHLRYRDSPSIEWKITECVFSNSSITREKLERFGGFDESLRMREDLEFGIRLMQGGLVAKYIPEATAYQWYGKTSADLIRDSQAFAVADVRVAKLHPSNVIPGQLSRLRDEPFIKRLFYRAVAKSPGFVDGVLAPVCLLGERFIGNTLARKIGVRALQMRRRVHWQNRVERELSIAEDRADVRLSGAGGAGSVDSENKDGTRKSGPKDKSATRY